MTGVWKTIQTMECEAQEGSRVTVFRQSDGTDTRFVLGNGRHIRPNPDGTFQIPDSDIELSVMAL
ncbi:MHC class I heavy chain [Salipiger sp. PrR003]|uniref:MHC class I heavy chain n=1 Tax=Salipiger sp. PrR003 TaxID=2706776 RepID=UPI0013D9EE87|nr:MHC class I heavy chain [Salipiger sp. PrR003]NDV50744.1 MHC class I heavy chain [Salipiger sp. PrR003]